MKKAATKSSTPKVKASSLPPDVVLQDLVYPSIDYKDRLKLQEKVGGYHNMQLQFYDTTGFGWVICTLPISKGRNGRDDRTYGVNLKGETVRVGNGPHVKSSLLVYLTPENLDRLMKYVELKVKGETRAGEIRDRISTRRARGQEYRAAGRTTWWW
jgi:hypothetical protein